MRAPAAIIVNRNAGGMRRDPALAQRLRTVADVEAGVYVTDDLSMLDKVCAQLAAAAVETVGIVGGDSTASLTLTAIARAYQGRELPQIALLRGGTMNTVASSLGIRKRAPLLLLLRLLEMLRSPELRRVRCRPLMNVAGRLGFLFGTGVWYGYLAETYRRGPPTLEINVKVLGHVALSAAAGGETIGRITHPVRVAVQTAQELWEAEPYLSVAAGTVPDVGFGFRPFHRAFEVDAGFQLLALHGSARDLLLALPGVWLGRGFNPRSAHQTITTRAELSPLEGVIDFSVDGDIDTVQGPLCIELGPRFEFLLL